MCKKAEVFWKDIKTLYETMRSNYNHFKIDCLALTTDENGGGPLFVALPNCNQCSLRQQWSKSIQPAINKFGGIHICYDTRSGKTNQMYYDCFFELYKKGNKSGKADGCSGLLKKNSTEHIFAFVVVGPSLGATLRIMRESGQQLWR